MKMKNIYKTWNLALFFAGLLTASVQLPALAKVKLYTSCRQDQCYDQYFVSKTIIEKNDLGRFFRVEEQWFFYPDGSSPSLSQGKNRTFYVFCSTKLPAIISYNNWFEENFPEFEDYYETNKTWKIEFLNPGIISTTQDYGILPTYWATCHNFIDIFSRHDRLEDLRNKAIQLGYPLTEDYVDTFVQNLQNKGISINRVFYVDNPLDFLRFLEFDN